MCNCINEGWIQGKCQMVDLEQIRERLYRKVYFYDITLSQAHIDPQTGIINVDGKVELVDSIGSIGVQFGKVKDYTVKGTRLINLEGSPTECDGNVLINQNLRLKSLQGGPQIVNGNFNCSGNKLTNLEHFPAQIKGYINLAGNNLTSLEGAPKRANDWFSVVYNDLKTLKGVPESISGDLDISDNPLENLDYWPLHIGGKVYMTWNLKLPILKTLMALGGVACENAPKQVQEILNKYAGQGKPGAIKAAAELILAGYKDNARW